jgi:hypothetical protein
MAIESAPAPSETSASKPSRAPAPSPSELPSRPWLRGAAFLALGAQVITISALVGADRMPVTWWALLLAIAPGPLAWAAALAPVTVALPAAVLCTVVVIVGTAGGIVHTGLFFLPALVVLIIGAASLRRGQA